MFGLETTVQSLLTEATLHPEYLYAFVVLFLTLSSFGLPVPEEIVIVTSAMVANTAYLESLESAAPPTVRPITLAVVAYVAVVGSDFLIYSMGKKYGLRLLKSWPFSRLLSDEILERVKKWTTKWGIYACGVFRFTPGLRFPGHFMCGALGITKTQFLAIDGSAALVSVPTQILLLSFYGHEIINTVKTFKLAFLCLILSLFAGWIIYRWLAPANRIHP